MQASTEVDFVAEHRKLVEAARQARVAHNLALVDAMVRGEAAAGKLAAAREELERAERALLEFRGDV